MELEKKKGKAVQERPSSPEWLVKPCWGHRQLPWWALLHIARLLHKLVYIYCSYKALGKRGRARSQLTGQELQGTISALTPGKQENPRGWRQDLHFSTLLEFASLSPPIIPDF